MNAILEMTRSNQQPLPPEWTDEELLLEFRRTGNNGHFDQLVRRYERELYQYLFRYLRDATLAEDVFQLTFLTVFRKADQFEAGRRVRPWLYKVATNQAIDSQRSDRRHDALSLDRSAMNNSDDSAKLADMLVGKEDSPLANVHGLEQREWVQNAVAQLPEVYRDAINLVFYQGLKYREAADAMGVPIGTVKSRVFVALQKLNQLWNQTHNPQS